MRDLISLPKADLHVHLEGSMRPATVLDLCRANGQDPPPGIMDGRYSRFASFEDFIRQYILTCIALQQPDDFRRAAYELCEDEAREGVRYAEVTFAPGIPFDSWDVHVGSILEGFAEGERDFGIRCRLVLDVVRGFPLERAERILAVALRHRDEGVVSLGLGGNEAHGPEPFADVFRAAIDGGLHSVPHAGEAEGPASIRAALDALGAERIGHGVRILEDPDLTDEVRERRIPLEVCPTSNVVLGNVASMDVHPLPRLLEAGLVVTLNSDDPAMFSSPVSGEYEAARTVFGMDDHALANLAGAGVRSSFADEGLKESMLRDIEAWEDA